MTVLKKNLRKRLEEKKRLEEDTLISFLHWEGSPLDQRLGEDPEGKTS